MLTVDGVGKAVDKVVVLGFGGFKEVCLEFVVNLSGEGLKKGLVGVCHGGCGKNGCVPRGLLCNGYKTAIFFKIHATFHSTNTTNNTILIHHM